MSWRKINWKVLAAAILPLAFAQAAPVFEVIDPIKVQTVSRQKNPVRPLSGNPSGELSELNCSFKRQMKGTIVAGRGDMKLISFNPTDWARECPGQKGVYGQPLAWVRSTDMKEVKLQKPESSNEYGNICRAYSALEEQLPLKVNEKAEPRDETSEGQFTPCESCGLSPSDFLAGITEEILTFGSRVLGNRCFFNGKVEEKGPECSFEKLFKEAKTCGNGQVCKSEQCKANLRRLSCDKSPWGPDQDLKQRFNLIVGYAKDHVKRYKDNEGRARVDFRAIPCIAARETRYLEPMAKSFDGCDNSNFRYQGLGMLEFETLKDYLSHNYSQPFRSSLSFLQRRSYYVCPDKLYDALGSSPELQVELIAYTLDKKLRGRLDTSPNSPQVQPYEDYNGNPIYKVSYGQTVRACISCLRQRMAGDASGFSKVVGDPVECLSKALPGKGSIYSAFEEYKNLCTKH